MKKHSLNEQIRFYEELSFNSHPSLQTQYYDGWLLRFSNGYTNRANSVNMIYPSTIDLQTKVEFCERCYFDRQLPCVFKVTDGSDERLDSLLEGRGYQVVTPTDLMIMDLTGKDFIGESVVEASQVDGHRMKLTDGRSTCVITSEPTPEWLEAYFTLENCADLRARTTAVHMMHMIQPRTFYCRIEVDGKSIACASAILERGFVTLVHVIVDENYRGQGYGRRLCEALLARAEKCGAHASYLQVLQNNKVAISLYRKLGYKKVYSYWYRVRR